jgi:hypothetical protein
MAKEVERKTDETGREVIVYDDGSIREAHSGHYVFLPPERAREMQRRSREAAREAIEQGILEAIKERGKDPDIYDGSQVMRVFAREVTRIALNSKHDRDRLDATEKIIRIGNLVPRLENEEQEPRKFSLDDANKILLVIAYAKQNLGEVIDGTAKMVVGDAWDTALHNAKPAHWITKESPADPPESGDE